MNARTLSLSVLMSLCVLAGALVFSSAPAVAFETHVASQPIGSGEKGTGAGQLELAGNSGVAVDQATGDVYIADTGNDRVDELEPSGVFMRAWGWGVADGLAKFEACGPDAFPPTVTCQAGISGSGAGEFESPTFVAVDNDPASASFGDVYVGDHGDVLVTKFNAEGALVSTWGDTTPTPNGQLGPFGQPGSRFSEMIGITVDASGDLGVAYDVNTGVKFAQFNQEGGRIAEDAVEAADLSPEGAAVDSEGNLFLADDGRGTPTVTEVTSSGRHVGNLSTSEDPTGLAVDSGTGYLYVDTGSSIEQFVFSGLGVVSEQGGATCTVLPEEVHGGGSPPVDCPATKAFGAGDIGAGAGVAVDSSTHDVYVADASTSRIDVFVPVIVPDAATAAAKEVKGHSATLAGTVNPDGEGAAKCQFVWGTTKEFGNTAPCEPAEVEGNTPVAVTAKLTELQPDTTYYYRLQATNRNGTNVGTPSADRQFATSGPGLQPGAEESVSDVAATSATLNALIDPDNGRSSPVPEAPTSYYFQYSTGSTMGCEAAPASCVSVPAAPGEAISPSESYLAVSQHVQGLLAGTVYHYRVVALSESAGELITVDGPDQTFTTQLAGGAFALPDDRQWELVSPPDKHGALILGPTETGLGAEASVAGDAMTFLTSAPTESEPPGYTSDEQVLSTRGPSGWVSRDISLPHRSVTGIELGHGSEYVAFSEDLSLALVQPRGPFDPSLSPEASEQTPYLRMLFENGNVDEPCVESCFRPLVTGKPGYANVPAGTPFGEEEACNDHSDAVCGPEFWDATPDLSRILLTSEKVPLVAGGGSGEYEWTEGRLSAGDRLPELRVSTSEDGSWKYFMSESVLASGGVPGAPNMYVSHGGMTSLVAVLSPADSPDWSGSGGPGRNQLELRTSRVSPDGRWFAFMSDRDLTGYDTRDAVTGQPDEEVYLYHAPEDLASEAGELVCASCDPTGARPVGEEFQKLQKGANLAIGETSWGSSQGIAANVPGWTTWEQRASTYQSRYLSDSGRLFFNSSDALVPQDVNGNEDVYEYEPPDVGTCSTASVLYSPRSQGCVDLISSGQDPQESGFLDASGTGGDVFFLTAAKLMPQDYDTALDVYDARECTEAAACYPAPAVTPPACDTGDSCKAAPTPQPLIFGAPASETFSGVGNVTPSTSVVVVTKVKSLTKAQKLARALNACHSRRGKRRRMCERRARARFARRGPAVAKKGRG
jgi:DNA-binding beta-propeller fold protein YncE